MTTLDQQVKDAILQLKKTDIRITPQRQAILEYLIKSDSHPTADDIHKNLESSFPNMSVATVYNNLRLFTEIGFVTEMAYGDSSSRFDFATHHHYHAICDVCGKVADVHYPGLDDVESATQKLTGYKIRGHRLELYGVCPSCQTSI